MCNHIVRIKLRCSRLLIESTRSSTYITGELSMEEKRHLILVLVVLSQLTSTHQVLCLLTPPETATNYMYPSIAFITPYLLGR
uniref:Uncharacterized protein n=1 Tax=Aegilops tauschii subsp. strangulata TaxID=200361 RepID=A0A452XJP3_AEGTS